MFVNLKQQEEKKREEHQKGVTTPVLLLERIGLCWIGPIPNFLPRQTFVVG